MPAKKQKQKHENINKKIGPYGPISIAYLY